MKSIYLMFLFLLSSCATKYILPGNRFITPETQGGAFNGQFELAQASANQLLINTIDGTVDNGVVYADVVRTGFLFANSIFEKMDFVWSHTGGGNSLIGVKFQPLGVSKLAKGTGHKLSLGFLTGGNEHETGDQTIAFKLSGTELYAVYGFRLNENVLPYAGLSRSNYNFDGTIRTNNILNGLEPSFSSSINTLTGGIEFTYESLVLKFETGYQQISTTDTKDRTRYLFGYSLGFSW
jgi:hypothetical protein